MNSKLATPVHRYVLPSDGLAVLTAALCLCSHVIAAAQSAGPEPVTNPIDFATTNSEGAADIAALCERAFANHSTGPVKFDESATTFRSSAIPVLQRIIALANACRNATIKITGHTDSSGDERWNVHLSLARAEAVADYLVRHGIAAERLITTGAGSSSPIADNATRYGRGLNRRIEFEFTPGKQPAPNVPQRQRDSSD